MKVYGIGTDITNMNRLSRSIKKKKFLLKIFDKDEIIKCKKLKNSLSCYAKRFAAKRHFPKLSVLVYPRA